MTFLIRGSHRIPAEYSRVNTDVNGDDVTATHSGTTAARCLGRIGGLAIAVGIGVAIGNSPGVAFADDDGTTGVSAADTSPKPKTEKPDTSAPDEAQVRKKRTSTAERKEDSETAEPQKLDAEKAEESDASESGRVKSVALHTKRDRRGTEDPATVPQSTTAVSALLGSARRNSIDVEDPPAAESLATDDHLAAEQRATEIVNTPVVQLTKAVLKVAWFFSAQRNFAQVGGPDRGNLAQLDQAVDEYAMQAAMEVQLLNPNDPKLLQQVMPPHTWAGQTVEGTRIWYDNPDTIYRFAAANAASEYVITGQFAPGERPADTNFSVLTGLNGETAVNLNGNDLDVDEQGRFTITVSAAPPSDPDADHLQLPPDATLITTRNTLSDWNTQLPMSVSIERVIGPANSLFAQIGGFLIPGLGPAVTQNPALVRLVSLIPPFADPPPALQAVETALLMLILGISKEDEYIRVATTDAATGELRAPNTLSAPAYNAQFLSTQLQSTGYFQLDDDEALVLTIDPGSAPYFVVPVTNDWTITDNYGDQQTSLNNAQAIDNGDGTYTVVVSKADPLVANWISTGGLNQGTLSIRFQGVDPDSPDIPSVSAQVVALSEVRRYVGAAQLHYDRAEQIRLRQAGYLNRYVG
ncbi:hypothetical protein BH11ACT7_BH11ACT7_17530 [soil metagenome]